METKGKDVQDVKVKNYTDHEAAKLLVAKYDDTLRYDHEMQRWLIWQGHHWKEDQSDEVVRLAFEAFDGYYKNEKVAKINNALNLLRVLAPISIPKGSVQFDALDECLPVRNGIVELRTGTLRDGKKEDWFTYHVDIDYDPEAKCPEWEQMLDGIYQGKAHLLDWIHRWFGYSITGVTKEKMYPIFHGGGDNGKTTMMEIFFEVLGGIHSAIACMPTKDVFEELKVPRPFDALQLKGKRFIYVDELPVRMNIEFLKKFTGQGTITTDVKHKNPVSFPAKGKLAFACNSLPNARDNSDGFWTRTRVIPHTQSFKINPKPEEVAAGVKLADLELKPRILANEKTAVLVWAVRGAVAYFHKGLGDAPVEVLMATDEYREESNVYAQIVSEWFDSKARAPWTGSASELVSEWEQDKDKFGNYLKRMSTAPNRISRELKQAVPLLAKVGISLEFKGNTGSGNNKKRVLEIRDTTGNNWVAQMENVVGNHSEQESSDPYDYTPYGTAAYAAMKPKAKQE